MSFDKKLGLANSTDIFLIQHENFRILVVQFREGNENGDTKEKTRRISEVQFRGAMKVATRCRHQREDTCKAC